MRDLLVAQPPAPHPAEVHPRPQLVRPGWLDLCGVWQFAYDDDDRGLTARWQDSPAAFDAEILVPFPPEAPLSGIGGHEAHPVVWYRREVSRDDLAELLTPDGARLVLHFGAVDYRARVWVDGTYVGEHEGGYTPFSFDITDVLHDEPGPLCVVVRAEDSVTDAAQPRGKQTSMPEPSGIHHHRTTGIWQPVWLERRPAVAVERLAWTPDVPGCRVRLDVTLSAAPVRPVQLVVTLRRDGLVLAQQSLRMTGATGVLDVSLPTMADGRQVEDVLWSPDSPTLLDADVELVDEGHVLDAVSSYVGMRSVQVADGTILINGRACALRAVLAQGFWPQSHLAAPSAAALRREVELVLALGFNAVRIHQKVEDPRFLYWCDRLGLLVWAEMPSAFCFSSVAVARCTAEWLDVLRRDSSHPCIVAWVPLNESWGVRDIADVAAQRHYGAALTALTRAVDPSRPVVSNDGWEHVDSDIIGIHDYTARPATLRHRYGTVGVLEDVLHSGRPWRRRVCLPEQADRDQAVVLSEFGGVRCGSFDGDGWGYVTVEGTQGYLDRLAELFDAVHSCEQLAGFCYTQLTDTSYETNGLLDADRRPKLPLAVLRALVRGEPSAHHSRRGGATSDAPVLVPVPTGR